MDQSPIGDVQIEILEPLGGPIIRRHSEQNVYVMNLKDSATDEGFYVQVFDWQGRDAYQTDSFTTPDEALSVARDWINSRGGTPKGAMINK